MKKKQLKQIKSFTIKRSKWLRANKKNNKWICDVA